jgi:hypothetical protein
VKRNPILLVLLMALVAACGNADASPSATESEAASETSEPTAEDTTEPGASDDPGDETALEDMIPDELNGVARTDIPGMETFLTQALAAQGMDAEGAEFVFASYGDGESAIILTAFRIPGISELAMQTLARALSGVAGQQGVEAEQVTVGDKSVLLVSGEASGQAGAVYLYFAEGAAFTIASQSGDSASAEQLLAELP